MNDIPCLFQNAQHSHASVVGPLGLGNQEHHSRAVVGCLQERIDVVETRFARHLRVVEVQCILNGAMTNDEISVGRKSPVLAAALPLLVSFICPLIASFSYLLVTHGVADQASQHDADQARQRRQPCTSSHNEIVDGLGRPE